MCPDHAEWQLYATEISKQDIYMIRGKHEMRHHAHLQILNDRRLHMKREYLIIPNIVHEGDGGKRRQKELHKQRRGSMLVNTMGCWCHRSVGEMKC